MIATDPDDVLVFCLMNSGRVDRQEKIGRSRIFSCCLLFFFVCCHARVCICLFLTIILLFPAAGVIFGSCNDSRLANERFLERLKIQSVIESCLDVPWSSETHEISEDIGYLLRELVTLLIRWVPRFLNIFVAFPLYQFC
jgi:hypothetical protein